MSNKVKVWDLPTRIFHWLIVVLVLISWISIDNGLLEVHLWSGLTLLTLLIFRIAWGIVGSTTARFGDFITDPVKVMKYLHALRETRKPLYAGHNPAGGWMVLGLITLLGLQVTTGLFANDDVRFNGPLSTSVSKALSDTLTDLHGMIFNVILLFVWVHVVAIFFYLCVKSENLIWPMITGRKNRAHVPDSFNPKFTSKWIALFLYVVFGATVWYIVSAQA